MYENRNFKSKFLSKGPQRFKFYPTFIFLDIYENIIKKYDYQMET